MKCSSCGYDNPGESRFCSKCGSPLEDAPTTPMPRPTIPAAGGKSPGFGPGHKFGPRYQIIEEIGRGGMGVVYKAVDSELDRIVALKMIRPDLTADPGLVRQFKQELLLASEISHENVIRIHDLGEAEGIKYISMKYIDGTSLKELIRAAGRLNLEKALNVAVQVCRALDAAHRRGIIHRDLKPQNIMLDRAGVVYVMDFGIANAIGREDTASRGLLIGTPDYISPEQAQGRRADERSDIYALGCVIYEMLTGAKPFDGETSQAIIKKHITEKPEPPSALVPGLPASIDEIVLRCLSKDPGRRYASAALLLEALESGTTTTRIEPPRPQPRPHARSDEETSSQASIAVMPFRDMSPKRDQEYFCDGMAEELINALVKVQGLRVAALTSTFQFKGRDLDVREIGKQLNVGTVLEGSVRKAGNRLRVTAQLVGVADGYHIWSDRYDREMEDIFQIQDEISEAIADSLRLQFSAASGKRPGDHRTENLEVYNLYLKGRYYWNKRSLDDFRRSIEYFKQAIDLDPSYAPAYAGLADCYLMLEDRPISEVMPDAKAAVLKALELDSGLAEAYATLAWISLMYDWDLRAAMDNFKKALALNPNYATAHQWYGLFLLILGRGDEALQEVGRARQLDPLSIIISSAVGIVNLYTGRLDQAEKEVKKALEMNPEFAPARIMLSWIYEMRGDYDEALDLAIRGYTGYGQRKVAEALEKGAKAGGHDGAMRALRDALLADPQEHASPMAIAANTSAKLGEYDRAFDLLEKALEGRESEMTFLRIDPTFEPVRDDPRFKDILRRMGFSDEDVRNLPA
jgi:serine/threonine protein kinase/tetratricopeptide (TPR) repeat protein